MAHDNGTRKRPRLGYPFDPVPKAVTARMAEIGYSAFGTYCLLLNHANTKGECWPHVNTLAAEQGVNKKTISRNLKTLEGAGLVAIVWGRRGNTYTVLALAPAGSAIPKMSRHKGHSAIPNLSPSHTETVLLCHTKNVPSIELDMFEQENKELESLVVAGSPHAHIREDQPQDFSFFDSEDLGTHSQDVTLAPWHESAPGLGTQEATPSPTVSTVSIPNGTEDGAVKPRPTGKGIDLPSCCWLPQGCKNSGRCGYAIHGMPCVQGDMGLKLLYSRKTEVAS